MKGGIMIIVSSIAFFLALFILSYLGKKSLISLNKKKILVHENEIITVNNDNQEYINELFLLKEKIQVVTLEKINNPSTIRVLESLYKNKEKEEEEFLEKKYEFDFKKNEKFIVQNMIKHMFEEDIKQVFVNYSCNITALENELDRFFSEEIHKN